MCSFGKIIEWPFERGFISKIAMALFSSVILCEGIPP
jgi:hypothetical protein